MGLPKFFKRHKKKDESLSGDSVKEDIPLPPQKPSEGSPTPPSSTPGFNIPPPPKPHEGTNVPGESSSADIPDLSKPAETAAPGVPEAPAEPAMPAPVDKPAEEPLSAAPEVPAAPEQPVEPIPEQSALPAEPSSETMDYTQDPQEMPPMPPQDDFPKQEDSPPPFQEPLGEEIKPIEPDAISNVPEEAVEQPAEIVEKKDEEDYDLPTFGEDELDEIEKAEVNWADPDAVETPEEPEKTEETSEPAALDEPEEVPEVTEVEKPKHRAKLVYHEEIPNVYNEQGKYFVKSDVYLDLFSSIKNMKQGTTDMENSLTSFAVVAKKQDEGYKKIMDTLHTMQESLMKVDSKLFEGM